MEKETIHKFITDVEQLREVEQYKFILNFCSEHKIILVQLDTCRIQPCPKNRNTHRYTFMDFGNPMQLSIFPYYSSDKDFINKTKLRLKNKPYVYVESNFWGLTFLSIGNCLVNKC